MDANPEPGLMVKYQFEISDEDWDEWKRTVPRMKTLDERIRELIRADTEGRVQPPTDTQKETEPEGTEVEPRENRTSQEPAEPGPDIRGELQDALPGSGDKLEARVDAVLRMYDLLQQREGEKVRTQDLKDLVDADDVQYSSVDSFWTNAVKKNKAQGRPNAVTLLPGVEELGNGRYRYAGENYE